MSIESATFIADLQPTNPPSTDPRGQGDDHIRLIKQVLQNSLLSSSRAFAVPRIVAKSANFSIVATDQETTFYVTTSGGGVTGTLPSGLAAADSGWRVRFLKVTSDANPMFIAPSSGTLTSGAISGLSSARRCIPAIAIEAVWSGTAWFVSRAIGLPIGSMMAFSGASLPAGYEWPNGQTLSSSANYPEYNSANGGLTTLDLRGRIALTLDNLGGSPAGRLAGGIITGSAVGNVGGTDTVTLNATQIPAHSHPNTLSDPGHSHTLPAQVLTLGAGGAAPPISSSGNGFNPNNPTTANTTGITITNANNTGGGGAHGNVQPSIMVSQILVVE